MVPDTTNPSLGGQDTRTTWPTWLGLCSETLSLKSEGGEGWGRKEREGRERTITEEKSLECFCEWCMFGLCAGRRGGLRLIRDHLPPLFPSCSLSQTLN